MAKTYNTISTFTAGQVLTAAEMNELGENSNNYRVPPTCSVYRATDLSSYTSNTEITWTAEHWDTDSMWASGTDITINTNGLYAVSFSGRLTASATLAFATPQILLNGSGAAATLSYALSTETRWSVTTILSLSATDTISAQVFVSGGSAYVIKGAAGQSLDQTRLQVAWLGQAS